MDPRSYEMNVTSLRIVGHVAVTLLAAGFMVFFWLIYKKTRKVVRRSRKICRRQKAYYKTRS